MSAGSKAGRLGDSRAVRWAPLTAAVSADKLGCKKELMSAVAKAPTKVGPTVAD